MAPDTSFEAELITHIRHCQLYVFNHTRWVVPCVCALDPRITANRPWQVLINVGCGDRTRLLGLEGLHSFRISSHAGLSDWTLTLITGRYTRWSLSFV